MNATTRLTLVAAAAALTLTIGRIAQADTVVQINLDSMLNGRTVSTFTGGVVVPWTHGDGVDGAGGADGFVTNAAEMALKQTGVALPDDGTFPANTDHPEVVLHFSNAAPATSMQTLTVPGAAMFTFPVPQATYSKLYLLMTSSEGAQTDMTITMTYADATSDVVAVPLPDYGTGAPLPPNPPMAVFFNLISGMHKWNGTDQQVDTTGHTITGVTLTPSATKTLASVLVNKGTDTNWLVFWGATGVATSAVDAGTGGSDDGGGAVAVDGAVDAAPGSSGASAGSGATSSSGSSGSVASGGTLASTGAGVTSGSIAATGVSTSSGSSSGATVGASGASSGTSSGTGGAVESGSTRSAVSSSKSCSFSPMPRSRVVFWASLLVLWGASRRRRRT
jgi:hypothetical protein